jgi:hypothetical protein
VLALLAREVMKDVEFVLKLLRRDQLDGVRMRVLWVWAWSLSEAAGHGSSCCCCWASLMIGEFVGVEAIDSRVLDREVEWVVGRTITQLYSSCNSKCTPDRQSSISV